MRLHAEIAKLAGTEPSGPDEHAENLSFLLAGSLPLDLDFKQKPALDLSEAKRLEAVIGYLGSDSAGTATSVEGAVELNTALS